MGTTISSLKARILAIATTASARIITVSDGTLTAGSGNIRRKKSTIDSTLRHLILLTTSAVAISAPAWGSTIYGITFSDNLITINSSTGAVVANPVGPLTQSMRSFDLAAYNNNLLAYDQVNNLFREINPANGATIASFNVNWPTANPFGEGAFVVKADGTGFLAAGSGSGSFYSFDLTAGTSKLINASVGTIFDGMALDSSGVLYGLDQRGDGLYSISTAGVATLIGLTGISTSLHYGLGGLAFDQSGNLYAALSDNANDNNLYSVDPVTGAAILIGAIGPGENVSGIAFLTPEPASAFLTASGLVLAAMGFRRRRQASPRANASTLHPELPMDL